MRKADIDVSRFEAQSQRSSRVGTHPEITRRAAIVAARRISMMTFSHFYEIVS